MTVYRFGFERQSLFVILAVILAFIIPLSACSESQSDVLKVHEERDFSSLAAIMEEKQVALLLEFHADGCPYCIQLEEEFLQPMLLNTGYESKVLIRKLKKDSGSEVIDFEGRKMSTSAFAKAYNITLTPTVLFLDSKGNELVKRIVGINTPSLFGGRLDNGIEKALIKIRAKVSLENLK